MVKLKDIVYIDGGIELKFEMNAYARIYNVGDSYRLETHCMLLASKGIKEIAMEYVKGAMVKDLLNSFIGQRFPLSLLNCYR